MLDAFPRFLFVMQPICRRLLFPRIRAHQTRSDAVKNDFARRSKVGRTQKLPIASRIKEILPSICGARHDLAGPADKDQSLDASRTIKSPPMIAVQSSRQFPLSMHPILPPMAREISKARHIIVSFSTSRLPTILKSSKNGALLFVQPARLVMLKSLSRGPSPAGPTRCECPL